MKSSGRQKCGYKMSFLPISGSKLNLFFMLTPYFYLNLRLKAYFLLKNNKPILSTLFVMRILLSIQLFSSLSKVKSTGNNRSFINMILRPWKKMDLRRRYLIKEERDGLVFQIWLGLLIWKKMFSLGIEMCISSIED